MFATMRAGGRATIWQMNAIPRGLSQSPRYLNFCYLIATQHLVV